VHVINQVCGEELTDGGRSSADAHVEFTSSFLGDPQRFGGVASMKWKVVPPFNRIVGLGLCVSTNTGV